MLALLTRIARWLLVTVIILTVATYAFDNWYAGQDFALRMSRIPAGLGATRMSYDNEHEFGTGFLPGDNETGVAVYPLPDATIAAIRERGAAFFEALGSNWPNWEPTPLSKADLDGADPAGANHDPDASPLASFLDKNGFNIDVDPDVATRINAALENSGSFYSHVQGGGIVIVAPASREAYLIYAG